jgi:hypothetical protein
MRTCGTRRVAARRRWRSVQFRVGIDEMDQVRATTDGYVTVGVTDFLLIVQGADPVAIGERLAAHLPRLRELG